MKTYVKPDVFYENFELSNSVAACDIVLNKDGTLKADNTADQISETIRDLGGFNAGVCTYDAREMYGVYGANITSTSY